MAILNMTFLSSDIFLSRQLNVWVILGEMKFTIFSDVIISKVDKTQYFTLLEGCNVMCLIF